jgi:hypothetical protein
MEERHAMMNEIVLKVKGLHGDEGLEAAGFEYRLVPCDEHTPVDESLLADGNLLEVRQFLLVHARFIMSM